MFTRLLSLFFIFSGFLVIEIQAKDIGFPFVRYFHPNEYSGYSQNWCVDQDKNGILYFANGDGLLEYDGVNWKMHPLGQNFTPSVIKVDSSIIWAGAKSDFGFFKKASTGISQYISLKKFIPFEQQDFGFIHYILKNNERICFFSSRKAFFVSVHGISILNYSPGTRFFEVAGFILMFDENGESFVIDDNRMKRISNNKLFNNIISIIPNGSMQYFVFTKHDGVFKVNFNIFSGSQFSVEVLKHFNSADYEYICNNDIEHIISIEDNIFAIATSLSGTFTIDSLGNIISRYGRNTKIPNETHHFLFKDAEQNLWIALDNGIAFVQTGSQLSYYDERSGLLGSVMSVEFFNNSVYAGTWQGLSLLNLQNPMNLKTEQIFSTIENLQTQIWDLLSVSPAQELMFAATSDGLFTLNSSNILNKISDGSYYKLLHSKHIKDLLFAGTDDGIDIFRIQSHPIEKIYEWRIKGRKSRVVSLAESSSGEIWCGTEFRGAWKLVPDSNDANTSFSFYSYEHMLPFAKYYYVYNLDGQIIYNSREAVFKVIENDNRTCFQNISTVLSLAGYFINTMYHSTSGNQYFIQVTSSANSKKYLIKTITEQSKIQIQVNDYLEFSGGEIFSFQTDSSGNVWIGADDGMFIYRNSKKDLHNFRSKTYIRTITFNEDSVLFSGAMDINASAYGKFDQFRNLQSIRFEYFSNSYTNNKNTSFRYKLEGFDDHWSGRSRLTHKEYTNLPYGSYTFMVQSIDGFGVESNIAKYRFIIQRPWYRTTFANIVFIIFFFALAIMINIISNHRLRNAKLKLEKIVNLRTEELIEKNKKIELEKEKSDHLLLNILPVKVAEELKTQGFVKPTNYNATVVFTDFTGFTKIAQRESTEELVEKLERFFVLFDDISFKNRLEKIKTIGDSHMSVGGIPIANNSHVFDVVIAALEMMEAMHTTRKNHQWAHQWKLRIGIHTGHLIAGIVGKRKFAYDVWGDTVNMSSRLQEKSENDRINISNEVYTIIQPFFECEYRGKITVKHKGDIEMYFVNRLKPEFSENTEGTKPNMNFANYVESLL